MRNLFDLLAILKQILSRRFCNSSPKLGRRKKIESSRLGVGNKVEFDALVATIDALCDDFMRKHDDDGADLSFNLAYRQSNQATESQNAATVRCPICRGKNRLAHGVTGARCGYCKSSLNSIFN